MVATALNFPNTQNQQHQPFFIPCGKNDLKENINSLTNFVEDLFYVYLIPFYSCHFHSFGAYA